MLINVKMPTTVGILTFTSMINFMLSWVEYEKSFDWALRKQIFKYVLYLETCQNLRNGCTVYSYLYHKDPINKCTHNCEPSPPPPSWADGVDECDVNCIVCCKLSPVSDPRLIVLRRRPRCPAVNPDGNPDGNPEEIPPRLSPKNLTIGGMTNHAHWSTSAYNINIQYVSYVNWCIMVQF